MRFSTRSHSDIRLDRWPKMGPVPAAIVWLGVRGVAMPPRTAGFSNRDRFELYGNLRNGKRLRGMTWDPIGLAFQMSGLSLFETWDIQIQMICRSSLGIEKEVPHVYLNLGLAPDKTQYSPVGTRYSLLEACGGLNRHSQIVAGRTDSTPGSTGAESLGDRAKYGHSGDHRDGVFG